MKNIHLVCIDPQIDFCCPKTGKLYVKGAEDKALAGNINIYSRGTKVLISKGEKLYEASLKK